MNEFKNVDDWRENYYNKLLDCRNELMTDFSLSQAYNGRTFSTYMLSFIEKHGVECVEALLANTIRTAEWDMRYDKDIKSWAKSYPEIIQPPIQSNEKIVFHALHLNEHPCILNQAARLTLTVNQIKNQPKKEHAR